MVSGIRTYAGFLKIIQIQDRSKMVLGNRFTLKLRFDQNRSRTWETLDIILFNYLTRQIFDQDYSSQMYHS